MRGRIGLVLKWFFIVIAVLFVLLVVGGSGGAFLIQIPFTLAFGWIGFFADNLEAMQPNWLLIGEGLACVAALGFGGHHFARWLWREMTPEGSVAWRPRWTVLGMATLLLLFVAGIATIGITHQAAWLFTAPGPMLHDPMSARAWVGQAISNGSPARDAVSEYHAKTGRLPDSAEEAGFVRGETSGRHTRSVQIGRGGVVTIEVAETLMGGGSIKFAPRIESAKLEWQCSATLPQKYLPASCRDR